MRGIHDVREEITFAGRPDLIVHDSGGFEAGADEEFVAIEGFLKDKSNAGDIMDRLHVVSLVLPGILYACANSLSLRYGKLPVLQSNRPAATNSNGLKAYE